MSSRASGISTRTAPTPRTTSAFSHQAQETPLNQAALLALENLKRQDSSGLQATLTRAAELLNNTVNDVNERAFEDRQRRRNRLAKLHDRGEQDTDEAKQEYEEFQQRSDALTRRMDESIRKVVDDKTWAEDVADSINHILTKCKDLQARAQRRNRDVQDDEDQEDDEDEIPRVQVDPSESSTALLHAAQSTANTRWDAQSLTERYSQNPTYAEFYKMKHYAQNSSENPPPLPHHSMWFAVQEGRNSQRSTGGTQRGTQRDADSEPEDHSDLQAIDDEDTEIQVASENRSCKCPLTFTWFEHPVTSTKCPHSFEKTAILEVINASNTYVSLSSEQIETLNARFPRGVKGRPQAETIMRMRNPKFTQCPEQGCHMQLTEIDLRDDAVLKQQTQRARVLEKRRKEQEEAGDDDEEDSDDDILPTQRKKRQIYAIGSSPASARRRTLIKPERALSVVPNSQSQPAINRGGSRLVDVEDADDGEDEDEDEDEEMEGS